MAGQASTWQLTRTKTTAHCVCSDAQKARARFKGVRILMKINQPTYLIAELAGDVVPLVADSRSRFNPGRVSWPIDITIVGSSGAGTIKEGQCLLKTIDLLAPIIEKYFFNKVKFISVSRFPNTGIFYLEPERELFDLLHNEVVNSDILFNSNEWPYNPHCTLCASDELTDKDVKAFSELPIPSKVSIDCFSLYQPTVNGGSRVHQF